MLLSDYGSRGWALSAQCPALRADMLFFPWRRSPARLWYHRSCNTFAFSSFLVAIAPPFSYIYTLVYPCINGIFYVSTTDNVSNVRLELTLWLTLAPRPLSPHYKIVIRRYH